MTLGGDGTSSPGDVEGTCINISCVNRTVSNPLIIAGNAYNVCFLKIADLVLVNHDSTGLLLKWPALFICSALVMVLNSVGYQ